MTVNRHPIFFDYSDSKINSIISTAEKEESYPIYFNQNEDAFIMLDNEIEIPQFPIHHDIREKKPSKEYIEALRKLIYVLHTEKPAVLGGLTHFFDPSSPMRPAFFKLYRLNNKIYLYLLRLDLSFHPHDHKITKRGTNDISSAYSTKKIIIEADIIPVDEIEEKDNGKKVFLIRQVIPDTWIGETGRGYFIQGIWLDRDITRFFSSLIFPEGARNYPYYPLSCKYRTICMFPPVLNNSGRKQYLMLLSYIQDILEPYIDDILATLKKAEFSTDIPVYRKIKNNIPEKIIVPWEKISIKRYLNENNMREYRVEINRQS
ncbi:hypothetical protein WKV44_00275 [Spirochaetia bacterium 38H-sp]|uniref:NurA domain-containing protein n=1 Tax=Rarispira pelagica TaxID=3141764 RepID=A0ABU9U8I5_9SPIR